MVLAGLIGGEASFLDLQIAAFLLCLPLAFSSVYALLLPLPRIGTPLLDQDSTVMATFNLKAPLKGPISICDHIGGSEHMHLGETQLTP